jgi:hypothetical protein
VGVILIEDADKKSLSDISKVVQLKADSLKKKKDA